MHQRQLQLSLFAVLLVLVASTATFAQEVKPAETAPPAAATESSTLAPTPTPTMASDISGDTASIELAQYSVLIDNRDNRFNFGVYGEVANFARDGAALTGTALEVLAGYALSSSWAAQLSMSQALDMANGLTVLYTGFRTSLAYAIWGTYINKNQMIMINQRPTAALRTGQDSLFSAEIGLEQILFNGVSRVAPGTGFSTGLRYDRTLWGFRASFTGRYGIVMLSDKPASLLTLGAGLLFTF